MMATRGLCEGRNHSVNLGREESRRIRAPRKKLRCERKNGIKISVGHMVFEKLTGAHSSALCSGNDSQFFQFIHR